MLTKAKRLALGSLPTPTLTVGPDGLSRLESCLDVPHPGSIRPAVSVPTKAYIEFDNVQVEYPGKLLGLKGVSLCVDRGEFVFIVGKTGSGKSTLIKLLTRELKPTRGNVTFNGQDIGAIRDRDVPMLRRQMGIVPQDFALLPRKRVWENVAYAMRAVGHTRREVRQKVPAILEMVDIGHRADAFPHELSGGEQQRVAIGRALINDPPLLLADEPTGNLDPDHSWDIMELLRKLNDRGTTVVVASHDMMVIHRVGRRIVTLDDGAVMCDSADELPPNTITAADILAMPDDGYPSIHPIPAIPSAQLQLSFDEEESGANPQEAPDA